MNRAADAPTTTLLGRAPKVSPLRLVGASCIVVAGVCLVASILFFGLSDKSATKRDFIEYWAAGQQLIHGADPYDGEAVPRMERAVGFDGNKPKIRFPLAEGHRMTL
jgi:hypothetical protein